MEFSLTDGDADQALICSFIQLYKLQIRWLAAKVFQLYPLAKCFHILGCHESGHLSLVELVHMFFGREQGMGQRPVIGQEQEAMGINVQAAHWKNLLEAGCLIQQVQDRLMAVILGRRNDPLGLIEQIIHKGFMLQDLTRNCNLVSLLIDLPLG